MMKIYLCHPKCSFCNTQKESAAHLFRDCQVSKRIWSSSLGIVADNGQHLTIQEWIRNLLNLFKKRKKEEGLTTEVDFIATLWGIWVHRNEIIFRGMSPDPERIMSIVKDHSYRSNYKKRKEKMNKATQGVRLEENNQHHMEWTRGENINVNVQTIVVDGAWKMNANTNQ